MKLLRWLTAGESHGPRLTGILEGLPAGVPLTAADIAAQLARRQLGHGRGGRMKIEKDAADIVGGVRRGKTTGAPLALSIENKDWKNWQDVMQAEAGGNPEKRAVRVPRPGHADLPGSLKYGHTDLRDVLERASARETAMRVALSVAARNFLAEFGVVFLSRVVRIGSAVDAKDPSGISAKEWAERTEASPVRAMDSQAEKDMLAAIDAAKGAGDTVGGIFEVRVLGLPAGLGSYAQWDRRLEGVLAQAFMSLNAIKAVEIGAGFSAAGSTGSQVHDAFYWNKGKTAVVRKTNHSGGIDGGVTTGEPLILRAAMKPIATLMKPLPSVDLKAKTEAAAHIERSDFCAVPAAAVIGEALAALSLADVFLAKFGGDSLAEVRRHYEAR